MTLEDTLIMIRPDGLDHTPYIITRLNEIGECVASRFYQNAPMDKIEKLYAVHKEKYFFPWIMEYFKGKPILVCVYRGDGVIKKARELIGPRDPAKAPKGTLRSLSKDSEEIAIKEQRFCENIIHGSDPDMAKYEIEVFFPDFYKDVKDLQA